MENKELISQVFQQYGISGLLVIFLIYKHYIEPKKEEKEIEKKKADGTYISWESLDQRLDSQMETIKDVKDKQDILNDRLNDRIEIDQANALKMREQELKMQFVEKNISEIKEDQKEMKEGQLKIYEMISQVKNFMIKDKD